jgi:hypothetical protein
MLNHLIAVFALAALCAAWVLFQLWLKRVDPDARGVEDATGCSGNCRRGRGQRSWVTLKQPIRQRAD